MMAFVSNIKVESLLTPIILSMMDKSYFSYSAIEERQGTKEQIRVRGFSILST